jgi:hypothetical protein
MSDAVVDVYVRNWNMTGPLATAAFFAEWTDGTSNIDYDDNNPDFLTEEDGQYHTQITTDSTGRLFLKLILGPARNSTATSSNVTSVRQLASIFTKEMIPGDSAILVYDAATRAWSGTALPASPSYPTCDLTLRNSAQKPVTFLITDNGWPIQGGFLHGGETVRSCRRWASLTFIRTVVSTGWL